MKKNSSPLQIALDTFRIKKPVYYVPTIYARVELISIIFQGKTVKKLPRSRIIVMTLADRSFTIALRKEHQLSENSYYHEKKGIIHFCKLTGHTVGYRWHYQYLRNTIVCLTFTIKIYSGSDKTREENFYL